MFAHLRTIIEKCLSEADLLLVSAGELVERHWFAEEVARVKKHRSEWQLVFIPQGLVWIETNIAILIIAQIIHPGREAVTVGCHVGLIR